MAEQTDHDESYARAEGKYRAQECGPGDWGVAVLEWRVVLGGFKTREAAEQMVKQMNGIKQ